MRVNTALASLVKARWATFVAGLAIGAAVAVLAGAWLNNSAGGLEDDPGIPPPEYLYLDNARVLAYLGQIEGGLSGSERRTRQITSASGGKLAGGGVEATGSREMQEFVERTVTPTATARFYRLLDRLQDKGYLADVDASGPEQEVAAKLARIREGEFVRIHRCRIRLPRYVQLYQLLHAPGGIRRPFQAYDTAIRGTPAENVVRQFAAGQTQASYSTRVARKEVRDRVARIAKQLVRRAGSNPRLALSCGARPPSQAVRLARTHGGRGGISVDLLLPVGYAALSDEQSLFGSELTVVGKLIRWIPAGRPPYVDSKALATFYDALAELEVADPRGPPLSAYLGEDVAVSPPGAIVLPVAIYK